MIVADVEAVVEKLARPMLYPAELVNKICVLSLERFAVTPVWAENVLNALARVDRSVVSVIVALTVTAELFLPVTSKVTVPAAPSDESIAFVTAVALTPVFANSSLIESATE